MVTKDGARVGLQDEMENPRIAMGIGKDGSGVVLRTSLWRSPRAARAWPSTTRRDACVIETEQRLCVNGTLEAVKRVGCYTL